MSNEPEISPGVNHQTGTSYTIQHSDREKLVTFSNASAIAVTVPRAIGAFGSGFSFDVENIGAGTVTLTPTTSTVNGVATLVLKTGESAEWSSDGTNWSAEKAGLQSETRAVTIQIDGGASTPSTGVKARWSTPIACTVTGWVLVADDSGSAVIDVLRSTYSGFPTTASIAGTDKPTLSSVQKNENLGPLTNWGSTALAAGDVLEFNLSSVTTCKLLSLTLNITVP